MIVLMISPSMVSGSPSKRIGPRMVYDPVDEQIILYGERIGKLGTRFMENSGATNTRLIHGVL